MAKKAWADVQVGDTVWVRDRNRSMWVSDPGNPGKGRVRDPRQQFSEYRVTAVGRLSLELDAGRFKLDRKTGHVRGNGYGTYSATLDIEGDLYLENHRAAISDAVRICPDVETLREIARLLGYKDGS